MEENDELSRHVGVTCNGCKKRDFMGRRYHCLACEDGFNLCDNCFASDVTTDDHKFDHAMKCIFTPASLALFYTREELESGKYPILIRCPYCKMHNFNLAEFEEHVTHNHPNADPNLLLTYRLHL
ncbi:E3 ubiquitin-protein ligase KCMF1-like [Scaptodrosophila lebanonensis]|uniref:RING-type E3 ubiquitin transferase n=1 Tax=Drosophila lebanonensis TaxID=7225 RepID=A0A6J2U134_DROLE|nr:E3 ubiquitin-protein ligase KCMF1-like [Scaptodrosophila lebanonensis]